MFHEYFLCDFRMNLILEGLGSIRTCVFEDNPSASRMLGQVVTNIEYIIVDDDPAVSLLHMFGDLSFGQFHIQYQIMISQQQRLELIRKTIKTVQNFPKPGVSFLDIMPIFNNPSVLHALIDSFEYVLTGIEFDKVFALESRGFMVGLPLAYKLNKPFCPFRKKGKLPGQCVSLTYDLEYGKDTIQIQKESVTAGDRVVIFDDVLATGGTMAAAIQLLKGQGADIVRVVIGYDLPALNGVSRLKIDTSKVIILLHY